MGKKYSWRGLREDSFDPSGQEDTLQGLPVRPGIIPRLCNCADLYVFINMSLTTWRGGHPNRNLDPEPSIGKHGGRAFAHQTVTQLGGQWHANEPLQVEKAVQSLYLCSHLSNTVGKPHRSKNSVEFISSKMLLRVSSKCQAERNISY